MAEERQKIFPHHSLVLENREKMSLTGVTDVDSFDDTLITAYINYAQLVLTGNGLHISKLNTDEGELWVEGNVTSVSYQDNVAKSSGFFGKIFR